MHKPYHKFDYKHELVEELMCIIRRRRILPILHDRILCCVISKCNRTVELFGFFSLPNTFALLRAREHD